MTTIKSLTGSVLWKEKKNIDECNILVYFVIKWYRPLVLCVLKLGYYETIGDFVIKNMHNRWCILQFYCKNLKYNFLN